MPFMAIGSCCAVVYVRMQRQGDAFLQLDSGRISNGVSRHVLAPSKMAPFQILSIPGSSAATRGNAKLKVCMPSLVRVPGVYYPAAVVAVGQQTPPDIIRCQHRTDFRFITTDPSSRTRSPRGPLMIARHTCHQSRKSVNRKDLVAAKLFFSLSSIRCTRCLSLHERLRVRVRERVCARRACGLEAGHGGGLIKRNQSSGGVSTE